MSYKVGYCKPPRSTRFTKGKSGNPKGRAKGARNLKTDLEEELRERIAVKIGGRSAKLSKQRALIKAIISRAIGGDAKATTAALALMVRLIDPTAPPLGAEQISPNDQAIIDDFLERELRSKASSREKR